MMGALNFMVNEARVPAGTVAFYAGTQIPSGWLLMDGRSLHRESYPSLYAAIGTTYGSEGEEYFSLPDARGLFLRGLDAPRFVPTLDTAVVEGKTYYTPSGAVVENPAQTELSSLCEKQQIDQDRTLGSVQPATMATSYASIGQHLTMFKNYDPGDMDSVQKVRMASSTTLKDMPTYYYDVAMRPVNMALQVMIKI